MKFKVLNESYYNNNLPITINWYLATDWVKEDLAELGYELIVDEDSESAFSESGDRRSIEGVISRGGNKLEVTFIGDAEKISCLTTPQPSGNVKGFTFYNIDDLSRYLTEVFKDVYGEE